MSGHHLYQFRLPAVPKGGVLLLVSLHRMLSVQGVDAEMAQTRTKELVLGGVLEQLTLQGGGRALLVDLDGLLVLLQRGAVLGDLQHALVCAAVTFLAPEILRRGLVMLHGLVQVPSLGLVHLGDGLMMLGRDGEPAVLCENVDGTLETLRRSVWIVLLEAVGRVHKVGRGVVLVPVGQLHIGHLGECVAGLIPLLGHLVKIGGSPKHLNPVILFARTSKT